MRDDEVTIPSFLVDTFQNDLASYVNEIDSKFGPFDGVVGFSEGGAVLNTLLGMREAGKLNGALDSVRFFIHMVRIFINVSIPVHTSSCVPIFLQHMVSSRLHGLHLWAAITPWPRRKFQPSQSLETMIMFYFNKPVLSSPAASRGTLTSIVMKRSMLIQH